MSTSRSLLLAAGAVLTTLAAAGAALRPVEPRCEYRKNPLGIDESKPRLSWRLEAVTPRARGLSQSAYQIIAASSENQARAGQGDLWDTGRVTSDASTQLAYAGKPLPSGRPVFWRVRVWDQANQPSDWSETAWWSTGLQAQDWQAKWIGIGDVAPQKDPASLYWNLRNASWIEPAEEFKAADVVYRLTFDVPADRKLVDALAIVGGDRGGELHVNGKLAGKVTRYGRPSPHAIQALVQPGRNVVAIRTERQAHNQTPGLMGAIRLAFDRGDPLVLPTGAAWRVSTSAGAGWQQPGFDDQRWAAARVTGPYGMAPWGDVGFSEERRMPAILLRKEFRTAGAVKRATVYLSGLGLSELHINGTKVSDDVLSPGLTDYDKRVLYVTHDVTRLVRGAGANAIGVMLGNGRFFAPRVQEPIGMRSFGTPRLRLQLEIETANGAIERIVSDETWKLSTEGPIVANNEFDGEEYDATRELAGWSAAGFADANWTAVREVPAPKGVLAAQMAEPLRVIETLRPIKVTPLAGGAYVFDMGQNMVGWCRLRVKGPRGTHVSLRHSETLNPDGTLYVDNLRSARALDIYTLKGGNAEVWEPRFTYHGFRFVEVRGFPGTPALSALEGRVVHDAMTPTVDFTSSDALLNQLHKNVWWGVRGNYRSIPTDCPQRDERQGWLGDRSVVSWSESYLFDVAAFYSKWETDIEDAQRPSGSIPDVAPAFWVLYNDGVTWPSTFTLVPRMLYMQYGDRRVIERHYPAMRKWVDYMSGFIKDDLMPKNTYGDWCVPPESPELVHSKDPARQTNPSLISTAYFYRMLQILADYAKLAGRPADATAYTALAARMKTAFIARFFQPGKNQFDNGTQTSSVLPLAFGLVPEDKREAVFARLTRKIEQESDRHIGVGLIGAQWLMRVLTENGRADLAYDIATQKTYPGWGYMLGKGATTIWELWNGDTAEPSMNSGNHVMQIGDLNVWLYEYLAGIKSAPDAPGFRRIVIRPYAPPRLEFVKASHQSMAGRIASEWRRSGARFELKVEVPANTTATVFVPASDAAAVREGGRTAAQSEGVHFERMEAGQAVFTVGSGSYTFTAGS